MRRMITPSTLKQTLACPPSAVLSRHAEFTQNLQAINGDILHRTAERCLKGETQKTCEDIGYTYKNLSLTRAGARQMQAFCDDMTRLRGRMWVEQKMDMSRAFGLPAGSSVGKIDVTIWTPDETVHIVDLKTGTHKQNPAPGGNAWSQCATYGVAAMQRFKWALPIKRYRLAIWQNGKETEHIAAPSDLDRWRIQVTNVAAHVYAMAEAYDKGEGIARQNFKPSIDNCRFCNAVNCDYRT